MFPGVHARSKPDHPAVIMSGGTVITYAELDERSARLAQLLHDAGLRPGDHLAVFLENNARFSEAIWAGLRSGLHVTTVNRYLTANEAAYIVNDCQAAALVTSHKLADVARAVAARTPACTTRLMVDGAVDGFTAYEDAIARYPATPLDSQPLGELMLYSSGTTGRPKGIFRPLSGRQVDEPSGAPDLLGGVFGFTGDAVYLSPAPLYHGAPLGFLIGTQQLGGTVVVMERFDPIDALALIERHAVTHSQWVPTMFVRMLKTPEAERSRFDLSSHQMAIHAAAPCPIAVKEQMIAWWGEIVVEYYSGTELNGFTVCGSSEWLAHKGTVGRPIHGKIHICDDDGAELPVGAAGQIYFELPQLTFEYFNDQEKTASVCHPQHPTWSSLGDVGYVDADGYLYLTDRSTFMIISGGVNIYPQEIEDVLVTHPQVLDVAVIGVPNDDFGEETKAVVQLVAGVTATDELTAELKAYAAERLAAYKVPRSFDYTAELPRLPTGKLYKRQLRDRYWLGREGQLV